MAKHPLESRYGLTSTELLDAIDARLRLKVAVEGAVAEYQMGKHIERLVGSAARQFEHHDRDGYPDFSIWIPGRDTPLLAECKNVRESSKPGGEAYRAGGKVVAYKVETQKTRATKGDPSSRYYGFEQYHILGVCLGKKTDAYSVCAHNRILAANSRPFNDGRNASNDISNSSRPMRRYRGPCYRRSPLRKEVEARSSHRSATA